MTDVGREPAAESFQSSVECKNAVTSECYVAESFLVENLGKCLLKRMP